MNFNIPYYFLTRGCVIYWVVDHTTCRTVCHVTHIFMGRATPPTPSMSPPQGLLLAGSEVRAGAQELEEGGTLLPHPCTHVSTLHRVYRSGEGRREAYNL